MMIGKKNFWWRVWLITLPYIGHCANWNKNIATNLDVVDNHIAVLFHKVKEEPLKDKDRHTYQVQSTYRHVSGRGREQIDVILHGASSLPDTESGTTPQAFVIVQVFTLTIWSIF